MHQSTMTKKTNYPSKDWTALDEIIKQRLKIF